MKIKKVEFTTSELNTPVSGTMKIAYIDVEVEGQGIKSIRRETIRKYPVAMSLVNTTGQSIELAIIGNEKEEEEFYKAPNEFFFLIPNNSAIGASVRIGRTYKVVAKKLSVDVSNGLRIDFLNHVGINSVSEEEIV